MRTDFDEDCEEEEAEEKCRTEFDYVCEEAKPTKYAPPSDGYGVPGAPPLSSTYGSPPDGGWISDGSTVKRQIKTESSDLPQYR